MKPFYCQTRTRTSGKARKQKQEGGKTRGKTRKQKQKQE